MGSVILISVAVIGSIALCCSLLIWVVGKIIHADGDSHIEEVLAVLPGSNCGLCGYPSCRQFATAVDTRKAEGEKLYCLAGGKRVARLLAELLDEPSLAVLPSADERKLRIEKLKAANKNKKQTS